MIVKPRPLIEGYVTPIIYHPVTRFITGAVVELVKIAAAKIFLEYLFEKTLNSANVVVKAVWIVVVFAPVTEEIAFRGVVQRGIGFVQKGWNQFVIRRELSREELAVQRMWRVQISAIIFAAAHLRNPHPTMAHKLGQLTWCYMAGVAYGYLSDTYKSLSVSILAHGFNNMLAIYMLANKNSKHLLICTGALIANQAVSYALGNPEWVQGIAVNMKKGGQAFLAMSSTLSSHYLPN